MKKITILTLVTAMFLLQGCWKQVEKSAISSCKLEYRNYPQSAKACMKGAQIARMTAERELGFRSTENDVLMALNIAERECFKIIDSYQCTFGVTLFKEHAIK